MRFGGNVDSMLINLDGGTFLTAKIKRKCFTLRMECSDLDRDETNSFACIRVGSYALLRCSSTVGWRGLVRSHSRLTATRFRGI